MVPAIEAHSEQGMAQTHGIAAAGHEATAGAAQQLLEEGGNAFDAALGALLASCVAEPVLASLGGGGFLLAHRPGAAPLLYDFFAQTPQRKIPVSEVDFYPILADFGNAQQEFHIGLGSIAIPGMVRGLFRIHRDLCQLPLTTLAQPALEAAKKGIRLNTFQHYLSKILEPILAATPEAIQLHSPQQQPGRFAEIDERVRQPQMADAIEALILEGEDLFYRGEMTQPLLDACRSAGGYLRRPDLEGYCVELRPPLQLGYRDSRLLTNPAPALGGLLIAFTLSLLRDIPLGRYPPGSEARLRTLARAMCLTQQLRQEQGLDLNQTAAERILGQPLVSRYRRLLHREAQCTRGTTQISVADAEGNLASMTLSNGEGSGYVLPDTGIMLNNMLGEEDINPRGFHQWPEDRRIASMMSPSLLFTGDGRALATGSGGSNRIRSAILQVLVNLVDFGMPLQQAVSQPRIHFEAGLLNLEPPQEPNLLRALGDEFPQQKLWSEKNLFFGGAHSVLRNPDGSLSGIGDPRRGGVCRGIAGSSVSRAV